VQSATIPWTVRYSTLDCPQCKNQKHKLPGPTLSFGKNWTADCPQKFPDYPQFKNQKNTQKEQFISAPDEPRLADCPRIRHGLSVNRAERRK
jgi:hypothetical protein